jgi:hypothetical protein
MKEYSLQEVWKMPKGTIIECYPYDESERKIIVTEGIAGNKYLYYIDDEGCHEESVPISSWLTDKAKFVKVKPSVSLIEVINSDERCKIDYYRINELIEDEEDGQNFLWLKEYQYLKDIIQTISEEFNKTAFNEILRNAKWYLESEDDD